MKNSIIFALIAYNILLNNSHAFSDDHDSSQDDMEYVYQEGDFQSTETSTTEEYQEPVDPTNDHGSSMDEDSEENSASNHTTEASEENSDALYDEEGYLIWVPIYRMAAENAEANMIQWLADALAKKDWKQLRFMLMSFNKLDELGFNFFHTVILNGHSKLLKYIFNNFDSLYTKNTRMDDPVKTLQIILTTSVDSRNAHYPSWSVFQLALLAEDLELFATLINSAIEHELPIQHSILQFHSKLNFIQKIQQKPLGHLRVLMLLGSFYGDAQLPYAIDAAFVKNILQDIFSIYYQYQHDEKLLKFFHEIAFGFFYRTDCFDILESFIIEKATQSDPARIMSFLQWLSKSRFQTHKAIHTEVLIPNSKLLSSAFYIDLYFAIFNCRYLEQRLLSLYKHALSTLSSSCGGLTVDQVFQQLQKSKRLLLASSQSSVCNWVDFDKDYQTFLEQNEEELEQLLKVLKDDIQRHQLQHLIFNNKSKFYTFIIYLYKKTSGNMIFWYNNRALEKFLCMWLESFWGQEDAAALLSLSSTSGDDDAPAGGSGATRIISIYDGLPTPNNNRMNELETLFNGADQDLLNTIENYYSDRDISF